MNLRRVLSGKITGPALVAFAIKIASAGLSYLMLVAFARMLGADDYGKFGVMLNLGIVLSTVIGFGLPTTILRWWPEHLVKNENGLAAGAMSHSIRLLCLASVGLVGVGFVASLLGLGQSMFGFRWGCATVAVLAAATIFADFLSGALRATGHTIFAMAPRDIVWRVLAPALLYVVLLVSGAASAGTAILCAIAVLLIIILAQYLGLRRIATALTQGASPLSDWPNWRKVMLPIWGAAVMYALIQQLDVVVVGSLLGTAQAGSYFAAQKTANLLGLAMIAGGLVGAPMMSGLFHAGRLGELQHLCRMISLAIAATTLAGLAVIILGGKLLLGIFDASFVSSYTVLLVLCLGYTIDSLAGPNAYLMQVVGLEGPYLRIMVVVYAIVLGLQLLLIPHCGAIAAAAANALGTCLWNASAIWLLRKRIGVDPSVLSLMKK